MPLKLIKRLRICTHKNDVMRRPRGLPTTSFLCVRNLTRFIACVLVYVVYVLYVLYICNCYTLRVRMLLLIIYEFVDLRMFVELVLYCYKHRTK